VRPALEALGLKPPTISSAGQGDITLWYMDAIRHIGPLPENLKLVRRTEGERIINLVGNIILTWVHHFSPNFPFARISETLQSDSARRAAEETFRATIAEIVANLQEQVSRRVPRA
jgi:hypothetical protein